MRVRGRPVNGESKDVRFNIRLTSDDAAKLEYLSYVTGVPKSEVVRKALDVQYKLKKMSN